MATGTSELDFRVQVIVPVYWILVVSLSLVCIPYLLRYRHICITGSIILRLDVRLWLCRDVGGRRWIDVIRVSGLMCDSWDIGIRMCHRHAWSRLLFCGR
jgi:hypothetical protein